MKGTMESSGPSFMRRAIAVLVLVIVAAIALRLIVGFLAGVAMFVFWVLVIVALVAAGLWARSTLRSAKRGRQERKVERSPAPAVPAAPAEDPVAAEMRRITEQLREQGRG
jgi:uncharacterized protein (DUF58 family)